MKVAVYDLYWSTYGGGEQVDAAIAECLTRAGHSVTLLGPHPIDVEVMRRRLGRDLSGCDYRQVRDDDEASAASADVDLFINGTYLSTAVNRAQWGLYYVHFPEVPATRRQRATQMVADAGYRMLAGRSELPPALRGVRDGLARRRRDKRWVQSYTTVCANSGYTAQWVDRLWPCAAEVLYPPVEPIVGHAVSKRSGIVSVGRFFDRRFGHCKKQDVLLDAFRSLEADGADDVALSLVGGADGQSRDYVLGLRRAAIGHNIDVRVNVTRDEVINRVSRAALFWHAGGFGEDPARHPDRFEHFGIAVVEAMSAGCVPMVFGAAGPAEIVRDGVDGIHWHTVDELIEATRALLADPQRLEEMSSAARERARRYSLGDFESALNAVVSRLSRQQFR